MFIPQSMVAQQFIVIFCLAGGIDFLKNFMIFESENFSVKKLFEKPSVKLRFIIETVNYYMNCEI